MKKTLLAISAFLLIVVLMGCVTTTATTTTPTTGTTTTTTPTTDTDPVILGADDVTIEKNSGFIPLAGVTASDEEDGDLTSAITYSGNVNPNAVGVYTATYTVIDSDGNITTVERIVVVVSTDKAAPLIAGVANETIYVGEEFDPLDGVSAEDTFDGEVDVTYTGSVDIWTPGQYDLVYSAEDVAGNKSEMPRRITVTFGDFVFKDDVAVDFGTWTLASGVYTSPVLSGFVINDAIADFTYLKLVITAKADVAGNATIALGDSPANLATLPLTTEDQVFTVYFILDAGSTADSVVINGTGLAITMTATSSFAEIRDMVFPTLNVPSDEAAYIVNLSQDGLEAQLRKGVTAVDNIDGNITANVTIDYGTLDLTTVGVYDVTYKVHDGGGNETTFVRHVTIGNAVEAGVLTDPTFQNGGDGLWNEKSNNGKANLTYDAAQGIMNVEVTNVGGWASAAGAYYKESTANMETGVWYCLTFTVKTTINRQMMFRMGHALAASPWYDDFDGNSSGTLLSLNSEWQTFNFYFQLDTLVGSDGSELWGIELNLGSINYSTIGTGGITSFKDVHMYKVVTEFAAPTYTENVNPAVNLPTIFTVGATEPDWATYVTAKDMSQNILTPIITENVDMAVAGSYEVNYSVTDSRDKTSTYVLHITVVAAENADTVGPVITKAEGIPETLEFDQYTSMNINYAVLVTIHDAVDGDIAPTLAMVNNGGLDFNKAGVYTVTYTCYDKSGNMGTVSYTVTIKDKQAPNINLSDLTVNFGDAFDPLEGLIVTDNIDGTIPNTNVVVTGLEQFITSGKVSSEGVFTIVYTVTDAAGNTALKNVTVTVTSYLWDEESRVSLTTPDEAPYHCTVALNATEQAYEITSISKDENSNPARLVYYFDAGTEIVKGTIYKFEITVKAAQATTLGFRIGSTVWADPWILNFEGGNQTIAITTEYVTYQVIFTADKDMPNGVKFQFQFGYNDFDTTNTLFLKQLDLVAALMPTYDEVADLLDADGFTGTAENGATAAWNATENAATLTNLVTYSGEGYEWMLGRETFYFDQTVLEFGQEYRFAITMKADTANMVRFWIGTTLGASPWIDTFENSKVFQNVTTEYVTYYIYFIANTASYEAANNAKFEMAVTNGGDADNILYVKEFKIEKVTQPHLIDAIQIDEFSYADETAMEANWTLRVNGSNSLDPSEKVTLNGDYDYVNFALPDAANNGWWILRRYAALASFGVTDEYKLLAFYMTNNTNVTSASVWLYWGGTQNAFAITLPAIGTTGWATIDVTVTGAQASAITDFGLAFNNWSASPVTGSVDIYDIVCVKDVSELVYFEIATKPAPINEAPVVSISDSNSALLSGLTLKAGENIESLAATLLGLISINDAEDGIITPTSAMVTLGGLDLSNPVMGSYTITVSCTDSNGLASNVLSIPVSIVTFLNDFESYADDAAFKAAATTLLYGFRISGGSWAAANGALLTTGEENTLLVNYGSSTNGIRLYVSKSTLESMGATYVGIYVKTSAALPSGSIFQAFYYNPAGFTQLTTYGNVNYADEGTYVFVKVADLAADTASISLMINVATGGSGALNLDNLVIK